MASSSTSSLCCVNYFDTLFFCVHAGLEKKDTIRLCCFYRSKDLCHEKKTSSNAFDFSIRGTSKNENWEWTAIMCLDEWLCRWLGHTHTKKTRDETSEPLDILRYLAASKNDSTREIWRDDDDESAFVIFFIQVLLSFFLCRSSCASHNVVVIRLCRLMKLDIKHRAHIDLMPFQLNFSSSSYSLVFRFFSSL